MASGGVTKDQEYPVVGLESRVTAICSWTVALTVVPFASAPSVSVIGETPGEVTGRLAVGAVIREADGASDPLRADGKTMIGTGVEAVVHADATIAIEPIRERSDKER